MRGLAMAPLAWGFGVGIGVAAALSVGAYAPTWGAALAFPAVSLLLSIGALAEREGEGLTHLLRFALGFTLGFLATSMPITVEGLKDMVAHAPGDPEMMQRVSRVLGTILPRWLVAWLALPGGIATLFVKRRRARRRA